MRKLKTSRRECEVESEWSPFYILFTFLNCSKSSGNYAVSARFVSV